MPSNFFRKDSHAGVNIVIISAACCMPGMAPLDEQARRIVERAIAETGVEAEIKIVPATSAFFGGVPKQIMAELISRAQSGQLPAPAVLINGKAVAYGMLELKNLKSAILAAVNPNPKTIKGEPTQ